MEPPLLGTFPAFALVIKEGLGGLQARLAERDGARPTREWLGASRVIRSADALGGTGGTARAIGEGRLESVTANVNAVTWRFAVYEVGLRLRGVGGG